MVKKIILIILLLTIGMVSGYYLSPKIQKLPPDIRNNTTAKFCVNDDLGGIKISYSDNLKSIIMVNTQDFMSKNKALDVNSLDQLLTKYNKDILSDDPACSQQLLKVDNNGNYVYQDIPSDIVFDKCWNKKNLDLDKDGKNEQVIIATIAMTKAPHVAGILKEGKLIFAYEGANIDISPLESSDSDKGFYLHIGSTVMQENKKVKYVFIENDKAIPLWQEVYCN
ncbi:MAG: hypothetical protein V1917_03990 [Candidatus Gottesmanbacteria bacterium]